MHNQKKPRTRRQRDASRRNGANSRGPVTPEGKQRSSRNAVTHGLLSSGLLLPGESPERFSQVCTGVLQRFAPQDEVELAIAQSFIMARWRQRRAWDFEAMKMNAQIAAHPELSPPLAALKAWDGLAEHSPSFRLLHRYERGHRRDISKSLYDLYFCRNFLPLDPQDPAPCPPQQNDERNLSARNSQSLQTDPDPSPAADGFAFLTPNATAAGAVAGYPPSVPQALSAFATWPSLAQLPLPRVTEPLP